MRRLASITVLGLMVSVHAACLATACGGAARDIAPTAMAFDADAGRVPPSEQEVLTDRLSKNCSTCHDDKLGATPLTHPLARTDAYRAALMVVTKRMPPPPRTLPDEERAALVVALCKAGGPLEACPALSRTEGAGPLVINPGNLITLADMEVPRDGGISFFGGIDGHFSLPDAPSTPVEDALLDFAPEQTRVLQLDATYLALAALLAVERCPAASEGDGGQFGVCAAKLIDPAAGRVPRISGALR